MFLPSILAAADIVVPALIGGAAGFAATAAVIYIAEITIRAIRKKMLERKFKTAMVKKVDTCKNQVTLKDLETGETLEIQGDSISDDIRQGMTITS